MQIVIDIPEKIIKGAKENPNYYPTYQFETIWKSICNGIILPKHGRLKDVDEYFKISWEHPDYDLGDDAPTILEATEGEYRCR